VDRATETGSDHLRRNQLGVPGIVLMVIAAAAPLGAMAGAAPLVIALGNGAGAPGTYLYAALALTCFAAGYAVMSRRITNAGAFYAYIARGINRAVGVGAAYIAVIAYNAVAIGVCAAFGFFANTVFLDQLGIDMAWYVWSGIAIAIVATLGFRQIDLSAKVLAVFLVAETLILVVMDVGIVLDRGLSAFSFDSFSPSTVFTGSAGVAFLFAFNSFIGFEATAIYGEESRDPHRTVARATYWAIALIGGFYALTAWCIVSYYGGAEVQAVAGEDPGALVFGANLGAVGTFPTDLMQILLVTSLFASFLGIHNSAARYTFALGRERLLPSTLGQAHPKHGSPWMGSLLATVVTVIPIVGVAISGADPYLRLGAIALALGTIGLLVLQAGTSISVVAFFARAGERIDPWSMVIGPSLGAAALIAATYLGLDNYPLLTGAEPGGWENKLPWLLVAAGLIGIGVGVVLRQTRPDAYARLGEDESGEVAADRDELAEPVLAP
jgi:amino acid transporter